MTTGVHVWVVERGAYSNYGVIGVYTTRKQAVAMADLLNSSDGYSKATVARWKLNPGSDEIAAGKRIWSVVLGRDGNSSVGEVNWAVPPSGFQISRGVGGDYPFIQGQVWATDEQHALKIANEYRAQAVAAGRFPVGEGR